MRKALLRKRTDVGHEGEDDSAGRSSGDVTVNHTDDGFDLRTQSELRRAQLARAA